MNNKLIFSKLRDVKSPIRAHATDAGIDFFIPNDINERDIDKSLDATGTILIFDFKTNSIMIPPHGSALIPSGLKVIVPEGYALIFFNKSGVATNKHLLRGACVVDHGFQGEVLFNMNNVSSDYVELKVGTKLIQGLLIPIGYHEPFEVDDIMNYTDQSERGEGGFGSSGTN